jgi:transducin (beta)-like 1
VFGDDHGPLFSLQADERKAPIHVPEPPPRFEREQEIGTENGAEVQTPAPRGRRPKRKSAGTERRAVNGDAMDVDTNDAVQPPTFETSAEPMEIEATPPSPVIPTLDIGTSHDTQTEKPRDLTPDTTFIKRDNPIPIVEWNPDESSILFTGGLNQAELFRIFTAPATDEKLELDSQEVALPAGSTGQFEVERFCWTAEGEAVVAVSEANWKHSQNRPRTRLVRLTNWGADMQVLSPISGIVFSLQYQPESQLLLCVCGLDDKSIIHVWRLTSAGSELVGRKRPIGSTQNLSEHPVAKVYDAAWISETRFIVCGDCELQMYETKDDLQLISQPKLPEPKEGGQKPQYKTWSRLRFDTVTSFAAVVDSVDDGAMRHGAIYYPTDEAITTAQGEQLFWPSAALPPRSSSAPDGDDEFTDFQWQPLLNKAAFNAATDDRLLAFSTAAGNIELYAARRRSLGETSSGPEAVPFYLAGLRTFSMGDNATAAAFAFSPDGFLIAAAGFDTVMIWRAHDNPRRGPRAIWKWKSNKTHYSSTANGNSSSEEGIWRTPQQEEDSDWPQSLQWDGDGRKLAFGVDNRVAIIRL